MAEPRQLLQRASRQLGSPLKSDGRTGTPPAAIEGGELESTAFGGERDHSPLAASGSPGLPGVFIKTFGCQMNEYDSEKMFKLLSRSHRPVEQFEDAEVIIVNTCSVREKGEHKLQSVLGALRDLKDGLRPELVIGVSGCVAQQEGERILKRNTGVDFVVGTHNLSLVPSLVEQAKRRREPQVAIDYREEWEDLPDDFAPVENDAARVAFGPLGQEVRALVAIQRGCNKNCAFCVVPNTRGPETSRDPAEIEREVRLKVRLGAREVLLLGQTVNSYGRDLSPRVSFDQLIRRLSKIEGLLRIRFTSPHPAEVRPEFIELYGDVPQLSPHIHLPLQSGSDRILKLMNRNYRVRRYLEICDQLRTRVPHIAITSDIIVGFPTETEEDFQGTLEVVRRVRYNASYSFRYSRRPGTKASALYASEGELPVEVSGERLTRLQTLQDELSTELNAERHGTIVELLVEGRSTRSGLMRGRIPEHTPMEVIGGNPAPGELISALVEDSGPHGLRGSVYNGESFSAGIPSGADAGSGDAGEGNLAEVGYGSLG